MFSTPPVKLTRKRVSKTAIIYVIDGGGAALTTGVKGDLDIPFACNIQSMALLADVTGSVVIDIWKAPFASYPPVVGNSITGGNPPTLSSQNHNQDTVLSGWTKNINAGDTLRFNINSVASLGRLTLTLQVTKA